MILTVSALTGVIGQIGGYWQDLFGAAAPGFKVTVVTDVAAFSSQAPYVSQYLLRRPLRSSDVPPDRSLIDAQIDGATPRGGRWLWAHRLGAVDAENTLIHVALTRTSEAPIDVVGMAVHDLHCGPSLGGTLLTYPYPLVAHKIGVAEATGPTGGANYFLTHLAGLPGHLGIARSRPEFTQPVFSFIGSNGRPAPTRLPISLSYRDESSFDVLATTFMGDCTWKLGVQWTSNGQAHSTDVPAGHRNFETTAVGTTPGATSGVTFTTWNPTTQRWEKATSATWGFPVGPGEGQCRIIKIYGLVPGPHPAKVADCF